MHWRSLCERVRQCQNLWKFCWTIFFMDLSRGVVGIHLTYLGLLKNKFQMWKERGQALPGGSRGGRFPCTQWLFPPWIYLRSLLSSVHFSGVLPGNAPNRSLPSAPRPTPSSVAASQCTVNSCASIPLTNGAKVECLFFSLLLFLNLSELQV